MKKPIFTLLISLLCACYLAGCSDNTLNIELPYGYELHSDVHGTYITGQSIARYPTTGDIIGFMLNSEYFYGWNSPDSQFFILHLSSGAISTFNSFSQYRNALMKLDIIAPSMDQELTIATFLSKGLKEINKQLQTNKIQIKHVGHKRYKVQVDK